MKTIAIVAQKGGTGKSTTAACLGAGLHREGLKVLHADLDPQASLSLMLDAKEGKTIFDALAKGTPIADTIQDTPQGALIAADSRLVTKGLLANDGEETRLKAALKPLQKRFDVALLDCAPNLGALTVNAMTAADGLIIPLKADLLSLSAMHELNTTITIAKKRSNPKLKVYGIVVTQYNGRASAPRLMLAEMTAQAEKLGISLSDTQIEQMIAQQPSFQENGKFSETRYSSYLQSVGMSSDALVANLRQDHALKMMRSTFVDYALVSKLDIQQIANLQTEQRTVQFANVNLDEYKKNVKVSTQEIENYYKQHPTMFKQVASVDVDYVLLTPANVPAAASPVTDAELQQAYTQFVEAQKDNVAPLVKHILITTDARTDAEAKKRACCLL